MSERKIIELEFVSNDQRNCRGCFFDTSGDCTVNEHNPTMDCRDQEGKDGIWRLIND